ncbi:CarD family transcriptional regulator [Butyricicoccus faecihominis]|uniref:CarD family transcriptional regulator n=1 Tax=Butyricicoccaceae TaxID=3085642 RepID=UPI002479C75F|nr:MULTISPECIES: CarD family transcriptional regulator [Butyricicoccaceae]MCQ5129722.1 CarD family transcriptional regulator [Butyricicoccus faecihominis]WNX85430.1 CarD family transcriptional regulator [Agathobaculum sp. NTUH-O15-33]
MFRIGDKIVHPLHGAGVIEDIVERTIDGEKAQYYALKLPLDNVVLFLPVNNSEQLGIRPVCSKQEATRLLSQLEALARSEDKGWNQRYRENMLRIRSGDLLEVGQVVKNLAERERERGLSTGEKKMLASSRQIIVSEVAFALNKTPEEAGQLINEKLCIP